MSMGGAEVGCATNRIACVGMDWKKMDVFLLYRVFDSILPHSSPVSIKLYRTKAGEELLNAEECAEINRCYVAVAEFRTLEDSVAVYTTCDSTVLEEVGDFLDLRFVPDEVVFERPCAEAYGPKDNRQKKPGEEENEYYLRREIDLKKMFDEDEIDFEMARRYVDMSDDEDRDPAVFDVGDKVEDVAGDAAEDSSEDMNEMCRSYAARNRRKERMVAPRPEKREVGKLIAMERESDECKGFVFDPKDSRFGDLFENEEFAIDPTHPEYRRKGGLKEIVSEKIKRFKDD
jgi:hypothetical protein